MYNFSNTPIPPLVPVSEGALLRPWFALDTLDHGLRLIREQKISSFHCIRNAVGAVVGQGAPVTLQFERSAKLHQGFAISKAHCGLCRLAIGKKGCEHTAALAILSLTVPAERTVGKTALPLPIGFAGSTWFKLGGLLFEWLGRKQTSVRRTIGDGAVLWEILADKGRVAVTIPQSWSAQGELVWSGKEAESATTEPEKGLALLNRQLQILTMTEGESLLRAAGSSSIGWKRDSSFWIWLAQMLFIYHGETFLQLSRDPATSCFSLQRGVAGEVGSVTVVLPREKTWEAVRSLPVLSTADISSTILPAAKDCFRVRFTADNTLEVSPCLRLAHGEVLARYGLADNRFSSAYYLEGKGFLPFIRLPGEGCFTNPAVQAQVAPLLGFLQNEETRDQPFTVAARDIPDFLSANRRALHHPDNIIQPELIDLKVVELPDRLFIDAFEEEDGWCYLSCRYGVGNTSIALEDIACARQKQLSSLPGEQWLQLDGTPLSWLYDLADDRLAADGTGRIRLSYREMLALTAIIPEVEIRIKKKAVRQHLAGLLDATGWTDAHQLGTVPVHLRPYQCNGLAWLTRLYRLGIGGLLADDMGLGKTHQGLALLQTAARNGNKIQMMVVCPASVVLNWAEKIDSFYPELDYSVYYGPQRNLGAAQGHGLILTTYGVVRQDLHLLCQVSFEIILLDEIQNLKNRSTAAHQAVATLESRVKIGLTGTPVENSLQDLRALFDICLPGYLGSERQFERLYVQPITEAGNKEVRDRLGRLIHPFILRRSRSQVLTELPAVIEDNRLCELSDDQVALYREVLGERGEELAELEEGTGAIPYMHILATITRLKQICCHPCLVQGCIDTTQYTSGKWDLFVELVSELLAADMKFVVFSQYTGMLDLIEAYLQEAGIPFAGLRGDMPVGKRQKNIDRFNSDKDCRAFTASLLAGGTGIDLTAASAVIHYDRWWNPAREEQATARVHRMGQTNVVQVFKLITKGTLEEKIHRLITKKRDLATSLIQEDEAGIIKQLDRRQLAELLRL